MRTRVGRGALAAGLVLGLWALAIACSDQSAKPTTVLSGNVGGSVGGSSGGYPDTGVSDDAGDDSGDGGNDTLIFGSDVATLCNDLATGSTGAFGGTKNVTCPDSTTATQRAPASASACTTAFSAYVSTCTATWQNALNCYDLITGACSGYTDSDCAALTACGSPLP